MADLENRIDKLETRQNQIENKVDVLATKVDMFIQEIRQQNQMRAAEIAELRQQHNADMKAVNEKIDAKFDNITKEIRGMAVTTILGVGAIVAAVMGFAWAVFTPGNSAPVQIQQPPAQTAQVQNVQ